MEHSFIVAQASTQPGLLLLKGGGVIRPAILKHSECDSSNYPPYCANSL